MTKTALQIETNNNSIESYESLVISKSRKIIKEKGEMKITLLKGITYPLYLLINFLLSFVKDWFNQFTKTVGQVTFQDYMWIKILSPDGKLENVTNLPENISVHISHIENDEPVSPLKNGDS